jgi:hypothetical protein
VRIYKHYTMLIPMVYAMTSWIGAHIYTLHCAHADGRDDDEFDRGAYIHYTVQMPMVHTMTSSIGAHIYTLHHAHAYGTHDDEFDRCACIHTTPCSCPWYTRW